MKVNISMKENETVGNKKMNEFIKFLNSIFFYLKIGDSYK